jgi:hypothetical protein
MKKIERFVHIRDHNGDKVGTFMQNFDNDDNYKSLLAKTARYYSSKETTKNLCSKVNKSPDCVKITKFDKPRQQTVRHHGILGEVKRVLLLPLAIVSDVVLFPLYVSFAIKGF